MNESKTKKKALAISVLVFLFCGGGVFLFLVFQGLGEYKPGNSNFNYGFSSKSALAPLMNFFSSSDNEAKLVKKAHERMEHRGLDMSLLDGTKADVSDWMAKGGGSGSGSKAAGGGRGGASASAKAIPGMGGGLGGFGGGGGGGSSSAGLSSFGGSGKNDNTRISNGAAASDIGNTGKGTLGTLNATRAYMKEGIRSGSAMTAKSKWDQGFGAAKGKAAGGQLAYNKGGLNKLDTIKKGDIADLKMMDAKTLSGVVPPPVEDKSATDELAAKVKGKDGGDAAKDAAKQVQNNANQMGIPKDGGGGPGDDRSPTGGGPGVMPDPDSLKAAVDELCPKGCDPGDGSNYKDGQISWGKNADGTFRATYEGTHDGVPYKDTMDVVKGADGQMTLKPVGSCIQSGGSWKQADFGTTTLSSGGSGGGSGGFSCN